MPRRPGAVPRPGHARCAIRPLDAAARRLGAHAVLLGHTRDDQAETVLLGLARGSGARSLSGMPVRRGLYRRPLLDIARAQTRAAAQWLELPVWQDPANADPAYTRARLRSAMGTLTETLGPGLVDALARTAALLAEDADCLEALADDLLDRARTAPHRLDVAVLAAAPPALRRRALLSALRQAGAPPSALARVHVIAVDALIGDWHGQGPLDLPGGLQVRRACGSVWLDRQPVR